jgi:hypothetical protein
MFTYVHGLYGPRNLQHVSILKDEIKIETFPDQCVILYLFVIIQHVLILIKGSIESSCIFEIYKASFSTLLIHEN